VADQVILLWKARWLNQTWELSRALRAQDEWSRRVFDVCQRVIVGVPGYATLNDALAILGYSERSVRRMLKAGKLGHVWQGYYRLDTLLRFRRAYLRTVLTACFEGVRWSEYVPLLLDRESVALWMAWHAWGRLSRPFGRDASLPLPDLSEWRRRFCAPSPVPGRDVLDQSPFQGAQILRDWRAPPVAVQMAQPSKSGYFATSWLDGPDVARLEWNRWVLQQG
jgi:hypothetical protein